jgi:hypothetical protein
MNSSSNVKHLSDDVIINLLSSLRQRAEKSDDLSSFHPSFVPVVDHNLLASRNTQVIYGRNGTGKTHILKCFDETYTYGIQNNRILPIYLDMRELDVSRISPEMSEEDIVELFFAGFIIRIVEKINSFFENYEPRVYESNNFYAEFLKSTATQSKYKNEIKKLRKALDGERMRERIDSYTKSIKTQNSKSEGGGLEVKGGPSGISGKADVGVTSEASREEFVEMVIKVSHFIDFSSIRGGIECILDILEIDHIVVLIDEWSQIDVEVQPIFSELIRRTLCTSNKISFKFAALNFLTAFTTTVKGRRVGLQPGVDITELADLNHIFTFDLDRGAVRHFLIFILIKHLLETIGREIYKYDFEDPQKFIAGNVERIFDRLFEYIFESADAFDYFVKASEGNPRDFLAMIGECCATHGAAKLPITLKAVQATAINYFTNTKAANFQASSRGTLQLFESIFSHCIRKKTKIFSLSKEIDTRSALIRDMWAQRLIHLIDNNYEYFNEEDLITRSFAIYAIDYGKILGLRSGKKGEALLEGIVEETSSLIGGLYDGSSHKTILDFIEENDSNLSAIITIIGATPNSKEVTDHIDVISPEILFTKINEINVDNVVAEFEKLR